MRRQPPRSSAHCSAPTQAGRARCAASTFRPLRGIPPRAERRREGGDGSRRDSPARERAYPRARSGALRRPWHSAGRHVTIGAVRDGHGGLVGIGSLLDDGREPWCRTISGVIVAGLVCPVNAKGRPVVTRLDMERPPRSSGLSPSACTLQSSAVAVDKRPRPRDGGVNFRATRLTLMTSIAPVEVVRRP